LPTFIGWNSASSHPRWETIGSDRRPFLAVSVGGEAGLPRMQSLVRHPVQTSGSRTATSSGDIAEATKLNCPIGQSHLQNEACRNRASTTKAAAK
jgi:hypothetical protein